MQKIVTSTQLVDAFGGDIEAMTGKNSTDGGTRTCDPQIHNLVL